MSGLEYVTLEAWCDRWGVPDRTARRHLAAGRIPGAVKDGRVWAIPANTPPPSSRPAHMRPAARVIQGELIEAPPAHTGAVVVPEVPRTAPEVPRTPFARPFVTLDQLAELCAPDVTRESLRAMLAAGEIPGGHKRGKGGTWIVPAGVVRHLMFGGDR